MKLKKSVVLFFLISLSVFSQEQKMTPAEIAQFKSKIEKRNKKYKVFNNRFYSIQTLRLLVKGY
jgi:outer membrane lipoprotein-sorting protein